MSWVTYLFKIREKEDFARCSNFLHKFYIHEPLGQEETEKVYFRIIEPEQSGSKKRIYDVLDQKEKFKEIKRPIQNFRTEYDLLFIIYIDAQLMDEIVMYQDLILIQSFYKELPLYCVIEGDRAFYHKLSQYLFSAIREMELGDKIFYLDKEDKYLKRMQENNVQLSTSFFPLLLINRQNLSRLKERCIVQLGEGVAKNILLNKMYDSSESAQWHELTGIVKLFYANRGVFSEIRGQDLFDIVTRVDTLSLILLTYSMKNLADWHKSIDERELKKYIDTIHQYANACYQLLENILFHSDAGWGALSVRIHRPGEESDSKYLKDYYGITDMETPFFELIIRDYSGKTLSGNIAEHFLEQLKEDDQEMFRGLNPENLFCSSLGEHDEFEETWKDFYCNPDNIGKHFGLRIFQRVISEYEGYFKAESHRQYQWEAGDGYHYHLSEDMMDEYVMPGTAYYILLPLKNMQQQIFDTVMTQEYGNWLCNKPEELFRLQAYPFAEFKQGIAFEYQSEKEQYIQAMASRMKKFMEKKTNAVLSIDVTEEESRLAELYVKTLIITLYALQEKLYVIIYGCTQEFIDQFVGVMKELYDINLEAMFDGCDSQIILISNSYGETVFVPGNIRKTDGMNLYISRMKGVECGTLIRPWDYKEDITEFASSYIPADVLVQRNGRTLFQECVDGILKGDIQKEKFGCKICDTHMRLGSTIHINHFFEAEILLGVKYFRTRFAFLILRDMFDILKKEQKITLYGYASYSEPLLVELKNAIGMLDRKIDVDYIVLEREEERRGLSHTDKIRYSRQEQKTEKNRKRKYIVIVPINSTLKTHQRLINLLKEEEKEFEKSDVIKNYALILVGTEKENNYWKRVGDHELECKIEEIRPLPQYYIDINIDYFEPMTCSLCFSDNPLLEEPLVETNAASTIPNQAFGIVKDDRFNGRNLKNISEIIRREEEKLAVLEDCFWYGHYQRNDGHYLYYCRTDRLVTIAARQIQESLGEWRKNFKVSENEYHILVVPMHFSNCGFVEMVNDKIFAGMASILRIDFNKEFRSNAYTKFSYIRQYIQQLSGKDEAYVKFHFVDDSIITGRTYFRAKSLMESITDMGSQFCKNVHVRIFDRIFVLVDRNSKDTKSQYISSEVDRDCLDDYYYTYLQLEISSLRNYGDSCVICNLYQEAELLNRTASTKVVEDYWKNGKEKFGLKSIEERRGDEENAEYQKRAFRRLLTTHIVKVLLRELGYNHQKENALKIFLGLLKQDWVMRTDKEEAFEYFISYLKVISRPFLVFDKAVKEAIFDILLNIICSIIDKDYDSMEKKREWKKKEVKKSWEKIREDILNSLSDKQKRDLVMAVMKQLTELKSNYIIRRRSLECFYHFIDEKGVEESEKEDFWRRYLILVKRLTGTSSDTSKSYWLDHMLYRGSEYGKDPEGRCVLWNPEVKEIAILENTRNFRDGIDKMYARLSSQRHETDALEGYIGCLTNEEYHNFCLEKMIERKKEELIVLSKEECREQLRHLLTENSACTAGRMESIFRQSDDNKMRVEICQKQLRVQDDLMKKMEAGLDILNKEYSQEDYQYKNFQGFCGEMGWFQNGQYTSEGICEIAGCLGMKRLCENARRSNVETLENLRVFVNLASEILNHCHAQFLIECENSAEYYAELINKGYLDKCEMFGKDVNDARVIVDVKRKYTMLASSTGYSTYLEDAMQEILNKAEVMFKIEKYGYYLSKEYFVWKLGYESKFPAYLCAKYDWDEAMIYRVRNLMMFKWELEHSIFDVKKSGYLHELAVAHNQLELYKRRKSVSHTDLERRRNKFQALASEINQPSECPKIETSEVLSRSDDMLILLADMRVSDIYRQSLNREFYQSGDKFKDVRWRTRWNTLWKERVIREINQKKGNTYIENVESEVYDKRNEIAVRVYMGNAILDEAKVPDDEILTATHDTVDELFSLLLALVLNPGKEKRGRRNKDGEIEVYISKTEHDTIRIANPTECDETILPKIRRGLEHEPIRGEEGITLWSMNCYLKRVKVAYARKFLQEAGNSEAEIETVKRKIMKLFEDEYQIKIDMVEHDKEKFFSCEIPVLSRKYEQGEGERSPL